MYTDTEGLVFKQVKTANGRRMILLFSKKFGKISAGTNISENGKGKAALAMRPFTYGRYELYKNRELFHINGGEVIKSYFKIGEDVEKYMACSYILEFTEKLLEEGAPAPKLFETLVDFFHIMETRSKKYNTIVLAFTIKALQFTGCMPELKVCVRCSSNEKPEGIDVKNGGILCRECIQKIQNFENESLIFKNSFDIINILQFISENSVKSFEKLALNEDALFYLQKILKTYIAYHLDISNLKSESFINLNS